jgi:hypothetical protein
VYTRLVCRFLLLLLLFFLLAFFFVAVAAAAAAAADAVMFFAKWISMHDILLLIPLPPTTVSSSVPTVIDLVTRSPMSRLTSLATSAAVTMLRLPVAFITSSLVVLSLKSAGAIYSTAYFLPMRRTEGRTCGLDDGANVVFSWNNCRYHHHHHHIIYVRPRSALQFRGRMPRDVANCVNCKDIKLHW